MLNCIFTSISQAALAEFPVAILTKNTSGAQYLLTADSKRDIVDDWFGECNYVPENDAPICELWENGVKISSARYKNFEALLTAWGY